MTKVVVGREVVNTQVYNCAEGTDGTELDGHFSCRKCGKWKISC